jgi:hypothetical protein
VVVRHVHWGDGADTFEVCTDPRRHRPARGDTGSDLTADNARPAPASADTSHAKRTERGAGEAGRAMEQWRNHQETVNRLFFAIVDPKQRSTWLPIGEWSIAAVLQSLGHLLVDCQRSTVLRRSGFAEQTH